MVDIITLSNNPSEQSKSPYKETYLSATENSPYAKLTLMQLSFGLDDFAWVQNVLGVERHL